MPASHDRAAHTARTAHTACTARSACTMTLVVTAAWIDTVGRSLREGFFMFWETLWPLILGFGLSGAVQSFVSRESMQSAMGDHRPASITRASLYGMVSSSCS